MGDRILIEQQQGQGAALAEYIAHAAACLCQTCCSHCSISNSSSSSGCGSVSVGSQVPSNAVRRIFPQLLLPLFFLLLCTSTPLASKFVFAASWVQVGTRCWPNRS